MCFNCVNCEMIDAAAVVLESCGQWLFRSPDRYRGTKMYLDQMLRKKAAMSLDGCYTTMIRNAKFLVSPPETMAEVRRKRLPLHQ